MTNVLQQADITQCKITQCWERTAPTWLMEFLNAPLSTTTCPIFAVSDDKETHDSEVFAVDRNTLHAESLPEVSQKWLWNQHCIGGTWGTVLLKPPSAVGK